MKTIVRENMIKTLFAILAFASLAFLLGITIVLFTESLPILKGYNLFALLGGKYWYPTYEPPEFGLLPLILASVWVTAGAAIVCIPLGVGSALYLHELAGHKQRALLKPVIELLASIPSIVYGLFGMVVLAPMFQKAFNIPVGMCALTGSVILGIMAVPTVCSIAEDALASVPHSFREAAFAVGANRWQTLITIILPAAGSGISTAIILGMSRAIGETMTVLMVTGGAAVIPRSFLQPVRPITATIAAEMGEVVVGSHHYHALFCLGLILFTITFMFNIVAEMISRRFRVQLGLGR
ncbi:MAG: phosphate ABC transporter permease subunit PstC [Candidatus Omnitrophica bacterium]|nr:phosphate ABC transporter permease subunit PstC [Candidatus Omnitrophota bacterium]